MISAKLQKTITSNITDVITYQLLKLVYFLFIVA